MNDLDDVLMMFVGLNINYRDADPDDEDNVTDEVQQGENHQYANVSLLGGIGTDVDMDQNDDGVPDADQDQHDKGGHDVVVLMRTHSHVDREVHENTSIKFNCLPYKSITPLFGAVFGGFAKSPNGMVNQET